MNRSRSERLRRASVVAHWIQTNGPMCPGYMRNPHPSHDLTADHVTPRAVGGENGKLRVLCRSCNSKRGAYEFMETLATTRRVS